MKSCIGLLCSATKGHINSSCIKGTSQDIMAVSRCPELLASTALSLKIKVGPPNQIRHNFDSLGSIGSCCSYPKILCYLEREYYF